MAEQDLLSRIKSRLPDLAAKIEKDYRPDLDAKISILDLSYNALLVNVYRGKKLSNRELDAYNNIYVTLVEVIRAVCSKKTFATLEDPQFLPLFNRKQSVGPIFIDNGKDDIFVVGKNFSAIREFVTKYISRNPKLKASRFGEKTLFDPVKNQKGISTGDYKRTTKSKVDIGHIPTAENENLVSPLESKIQSVLEYGISSGSSKIQSIAKNALDTLYKVQADIAYNFKNTAPEAIERAQKILGTGYIVLTLHTDRKNNQFAVLEKRIYDKLLAELALSLKLDTVSGSNTIRQDIKEGLINILLARGKKLTRHKPQQGKIGIKVKSNTSIQTVKPTLPDVRFYRTLQLSPTSLASLMMQINSNLHDQLKKNMGTGNSKNVLNYRSGRFAKSVEVEKLSESRQGALTAFYSYMKYPYATFSRGGQQDRPYTRDPKTLISKSIRELAGQQVANRMRAVNV
jgi:hypothetical protein